MEEKDPIENRFKSSFAGYEKEPPARVWENLSRELHPEVKVAGFWTRIFTFSLLAPKTLGFYLTLGGIAVSMFFTVVYFGSGEHRTIRGHAYAGRVRLHHGSAELFQVADKAMPWDSATLYRSAIIDNYGHFQFSRIKTGKFILLISPEINSESEKKFLPSWYNQHEGSDSCSMILINGDDVNIEVHLVEKGEAAKKRN